MAKLSVENKKEIIRLRESGETVSKISEKFNVNRSIINNLLKKHEIHGDKIFEKSYHSYPADYKLQIVNRVLSGEAIFSLASEYNLSCSVVNSWLERYHKNGYNGLVDKVKGRPATMKKVKTYDDPKDKEIDELKQKNLELEAEVEALKKLRALVLQRNAQQLKKKQ